jgi:hypothetical protein
MCKGDSTMKLLFLAWCGGLGLCATWEAKESFEPKEFAVSMSNIARSHLKNKIK